MHTNQRITKLKKAEFECFYGGATLIPSSLTEYEHYESKEKIITHINHPITSENSENENITCIWLKTYGLSYFYIRCFSEDSEEIIKEFNLIKP
jgi:hypothetical protein